jgi:hypothetical protein
LHTEHSSGSLRYVAEFAESTQQLFTGLQKIYFAIQTNQAFRFTNEVTGAQAFFAPMRISIAQTFSITAEGFGFSHQEDEPTNGTRLIEDIDQETGPIALSQCPKSLAYRMTMF